MNTQFLPSGIAILYNQLRSITSKLLRTAGKIAFSVKCKKLHLTPTFATIKGNFYNEQDRFSASKKILDANLREQHLKYRSLIVSLTVLQQQIVCEYGRGALKLLSNKNVNSTP